MDTSSPTVFLTHETAIAALREGLIDSVNATYQTGTCRRVPVLEEAIAIANADVAFVWAEAPAWVPGELRRRLPPLP